MLEVFILPCLYVLSIRVVIVDSPVGLILISPNHGNELGGTPVTINGPCFDVSDNISCLFDNITVPGARVSQYKALCVSPMFDTITGPVDFKLKVNGSTSTAVPFYLCKLIII